eukprot:12355356-Heterocapsa_arctica.AAC.1
MAPLLPAARALRAPVLPSAPARARARATATANRASGAQQQGQGYGRSSVRQRRSTIMYY